MASTSVPDLMVMALDFSLHRDELEQPPVQPLVDQRFAKADEGGAFRRGLASGKAAEPAERGAVVECFGQLHIRQIVPDRKKQSLEHRERRPRRFTLGTAVDGGKKRSDRSPIDDCGQIVQ